MPAASRILIVGGGVGGLAAATACGRRGLQVDLVEANPEHRVYGVGIIQPNNALRALASLDLADACIEQGGPFDGWDVFGPDGGFLVEASVTNAAAPNYPAVNGITRPALQQILLDGARAAGATIRLGVSFEDFVIHDDRVDVRFTDGSTGTYDLLVGCDGIYSKTRSILFPDAPTPRFTGQFVWRYNFDRPPEITRGRAYAGPQTKLGLVPMSPTTMYMFLITHEPTNPRLPPEALAELMRGHLQGFTGLVAELRERIVNPAQVVVRPMESMLLPAPWHSGRALLIGDAAHATTPHLAQGAAMAIEDAVLLGELLAGDRALPDVLDQFMHRRFERCRLVVDSSAQITAWELESWAGNRQRDTDAAMLAASATTALMDAY